MLDGEVAVTTDSTGTKFYSWRQFEVGKKGGATELTTARGHTKDANQYHITLVVPATLIRATSCVSVTSLLRTSFPVLVAHICFRSI